MLNLPPTILDRLFFGDDTYVVMLQNFEDILEELLEEIFIFIKS